MLIRIAESPAFCLYIKYCSEHRS